MPGKKRVEIDFGQCVAMERRGMTLEQIAKHYGISYSYIKALYGTWKRATFVNEITDIGKVHALHNAGWSDEKIADEFQSSVEEVMKALGKEPPKIEEEDHDAEFYGKQDI